MVHPVRQREYDRLVRSMLRDAVTGEEQAIRRTIAALEAMQERVAARLLAASLEWERLDALSLQRGLRETLAQLTAQLEQDLEATLDLALRDALRKHGQWSQLFGLPQAYVGAQPALAQVVTQSTTTLVQAVTMQQMDALVVQLRTASLGEVPFQTAIRNVMGTLNSNRMASFGPFRTVRQRAEAIVRTEVHRMYALADEIAYKQLDRDVPGTRYSWVQGWSLNPRETHAATAAETAANPIGPDELFNVGGYKARYPHDPLLPAKESVHCSCRKMPRFDAVDWKALGDRAFGVAA